MVTEAPDAKTEADGTRHVVRRLLFKMGINEDLIQTESKVRPSGDKACVAYPTSNRLKF